MHCFSKNEFEKILSKEVSISENWEKACTLFQEMETNGIQPDSVACSAVMRALNKGGQSSKVLILAEDMREKEIPFNDSTFFEIISACSL